ncbi:hypothetical protein QWA68_015023 [Fusarium oxysporum]|nr:hypothetical protein QWA68_015023 [Fusarium oxysporum]
MRSGSFFSVFPSPDTTFYIGLWARVQGTSYRVRPTHMATSDSRASTPLWVVPSLRYWTVVKLAQTAP